MKQIKINLDKISIQNAINETKKIIKIIKQKAPKNFIDKCFDWIINRANNYYLNSISMDERILFDISNSWEKEINGSQGILRNTSNKSVFVEFGVGTVAEENPHPNASNSNYEYNVDSGKKDSKGQWRFRLDIDEPIDLVVNYYDMKSSGEKIKIKTKGSPVNLYLYNSIMDLISTSEYEKIWKQTLKSLI